MHCIDVPSHADAEIIVLSVAQVIITHNVIRRQLLSVIAKAPTVAPANQEAFLKYASFAAWLIKAYLRSTTDLFLFNSLHESNSIPPYVREFEHQLAIAPGDSNTLPLEEEHTWTGSDIALAAERLRDALLPHFERREATLKATARGMPVQAFRETQRDMRKTVKESKVGNTFALAMIAAHQTSAETALFPSVSKMAGSVMYGR